MTQDLRNIFISHIHEDDDGLRDLKDLVARHGMICRDGSITTGKFNSASNEDYPVKQDITLKLDEYIIDWFKDNAPNGQDYQENINQALLEHIRQQRFPPHRQRNQQPKLGRPT